MTDLIKYGAVDSEVKNALAKSMDSAIEIIIPDDISPAMAVRWSRGISILLDRNESERAVWLQAAGRLHFLARENRAILEEADCQTISDYEAKVLVCKNHLATVWKYSRAYKAFPGLTPSDVAEIGSTNLEIASRVVPPDASPSQRKRILQRAKELPTKEFRDWIEQKSGVSAPGETTTDSFPLIGSAADVKHLKTWLADPRFVEFTGAANPTPLQMILAAIEEASSVFPKEPEKIQTGAQEEGGGW